jgi:hypothetical protein
LIIQNLDNFVEGQKIKGNKFCKSPLAAFGKRRLGGVERFLIGSGLAGWGVFLRMPPSKIFLF